MEQSNIQIIQELLAEFRVHRDAIMGMIGDLEKMKTQVDRLFPEKLDARYMRFFEEKLKSATELFKTLLDMRKELQKSLKEEIELRRKIDVGDEDRDIEKIIDIRALADKVQGFQDDRVKMRKKTIDRAQKETDEIAAEIVTVQHSG